MNNSDWTTKENSKTFAIFDMFVLPMEKYMKKGKEMFFPTNPNLADILGDTDLDCENC